MDIKEILIQFLGYLLLTLGLYSIYYVFFRKDKEEKDPDILQKKWFKIVLLLVSIACIIIGWVIIAR